jgi:hypothetical protein
MASNPPKVAVSAQVATSIVALGAMALATSASMSASLSSPFVPGSVQLLLPLPRPLLFGADLGAMDQISLAEHTDQIPRSVDDGKGADVVLRQQLDGFSDVGLGVNRHDVADHYIYSAHRRPR